MKSGVGLKSAVSIDDLSIEELRALAREQLRREYTRLRESRVRLWLSGREKDKYVGRT